MDCPRCASDNSNDEEFCWMCRRDLSEVFNSCDRCGFEVEEGEGCLICEPTPEYEPPDE